MIFRQTLMKIQVSVKKIDFLAPKTVNMIYTTVCIMNFSEKNELVLQKFNIPIKTGKFSSFYSRLLKNF